MSNGSYGISFAELTGNYGFNNAEPYFPIVPFPWYGDIPKKPKDYLWCTKGWENDCLHVKLLNASPKFYTDQSDVMSERDWEQGSGWVDHRTWTAAGSGFQLQWAYLAYKDAPFGGWDTDWVCEMVFREPEVDEENLTVRMHWTWKRWRKGYGGGSFNFPLKPEPEDVKQGITPEMDSGTSTYHLVPINGHWAYPHVSLEGACLFDEQDRQVASDFELSNSWHGIYMQDTVKQPDVVSKACAKAYYQALQNCVDKLNDNNIQNIGELATIAAAFLVLPLVSPGRSLVNRLADGMCDFVKVESYSKRVINYGGKYYYVTNYYSDHARKAIRKTIKTLVGLWLPYRYAYCTSQQDVEDAADYIDKRLTESMSSFPGGIQRAYGSGTCTAKNGTQGRVRCRLNWRPADQPKGLENWNKLWRMGLEVNPYVIWDMIPFSFVVDWFAPVGDTAKVVSDLPHLLAMVDVDGVCFSNKYVHTPEPGITFQVYNRWHSFVTPDLLESVVPSNPSTAVKLKRTNDIVALIGGKTL